MAIMAVYMIFKKGMSLQRSHCLQAVDNNVDKMAAALSVYHG